MNIQIDSYNFITLFISLITLLVGYYSLIANRPRIFLKAVYVNNNVSQNGLINFDWNFNMKFINYGAKPAFNVKLFYKYEDYINSFLDEVTELNLDKESFRNSIDKSLEKDERDFYQAIHIAKVNEKHLYEKNKKYLKSLMEKEISFIEGNSYELKNLGIGNKVSKGGLKQKNHSVHVQYQDLRDLNILMVIILSLIYIIPYSIFFIYGYINFLPLFLSEISNRTGFIFNIFEFKYIRIFKDKIEIKVEPENTYFEYDELLNKLDNINNSIINTNVFNEQIYITWEKNLTKSEYKAFRKYRLRYSDNIADYVELYKRRKSEIPKQLSLHLKLWELIEIFYNKKAIDLTTYVGLDIIRQLSQQT